MEPTEVPNAIRMLVSVSLGGKPLNAGFVYTDPWTTPADRQNMIDAGWAEPDEGTPAVTGGVLASPPLTHEKEGTAEVIVPLDGQATIPIDGIVGADAITGGAEQGKTKRGNARK